MTNEAQAQEQEQDPLDKLCEHFPDYTWSVHMHGWQGIATGATLTVLPNPRGFLAYHETPKRTAARSATTLLHAATSAVEAP